ncbi:putative ammonium transporter [Trypanosoma cruzi]|nr:putative ammonium transporter [Trypanosoma cruzi]
MSSGASTEGKCLPEDSDISWVLMSSVLVLGMMPGLGFFEAGLLRSKNTTSVFAQIFSGCAVLSVLWVCAGYSLTMGRSAGGKGIIGTFRRAFMMNVDYNTCYGGTVIPEALFAFFQMMFATITPLLMTGAYAERLAFRPFLFFTILWEIIVYFFVAHWIWAPEGWMRGMGVQDFAGGIVIHVTAGVSSLVCAVVLGRRRDFHIHRGEAPYSSLPLTCIGATMLWTGWFGFNGGSALQSGKGAVYAVINSQVAAAVCSCCFLFFHMLRTKKASLIAMINGAIAGLAGITPTSGYITVPSSIICAFFIAFFATVSVYLIKHKLRIDDALDVSSIHGVPGLVGAVFIGFSGSSAVGGADGLLYGGGIRLLGLQCLGCIVAATWAGFWTFVILLIIGRFYRLRVTDEQEHHGLDHGQHSEVAWILQAPNVGGDALPIKNRKHVKQFRNSSLFIGETGTYIVEKERGDSILVVERVNNDEVDIDDDPREEGFNTMTLAVNADARNEITTDIDERLINCS